MEKYDTNVRTSKVSGNPEKGPNSCYLLPRLHTRILNAMISGGDREQTEGAGSFNAHIG
jgi:hypothetical protein